MGHKLTNHLFAAPSKETAVILNLVEKNFKSGITGKNIKMTEYGQFFIFEAVANSWQAVTFNRFSSEHKHIK